MDNRMFSTRSIWKVMLITAVLSACLAIGFGHQVAYASQTSTEPSSALQIAGYDTTPPKITGISFQKTITKPGIVKVSLDLEEEETGMVSCWLNYWQVKDGWWVGESSIITARASWDEPVFTGSCEVNLLIPSTTQTGEYVLRMIEVKDQAGNTTGYELNDNWNVLDCWTFSMGKLVVNRGSNSLNVIDEFDVEFQYYITNSGIEKKLAAMPEGGVAMINYNGAKHVARKTLFDAIKGQDKTIVFSSDGYQWVVNGKDVTGKTKDVDLYFSEQRIPASEIGTTVDGIALAFADNGELPGKMQARFKTDYLFGGGVKASDLRLYYDSGSTYLEEEGSLEMLPDGDKGWYHVDLTHNSSFVIAAQVVRKNLANATVKVKDIAYTGRELKPKPSVKLGAKVLKAGVDYTLSYKNNKNAGTATVTVKGKGGYCGSKSVKFKIAKAKNPIKVKAKSKTFKVKEVRKGKAAFKSPVSVKKAKGKISYKNVSTANKAKKLKVNAKTGTITVPKGTKRGAYKVKVKVTAKGNENYKKASTTATVNLTVK